MLEQSSVKDTFFSGVNGVLDLVARKIFALRVKYPPADQKRPTQCSEYQKRAQ